MFGPTISAPEIASLYGIAKNSVYRLHERHPGFPGPLCIGSRRVWDREAVMAHHAAWRSAGDMAVAGTALAVGLPVPATPVRATHAQLGHATTVRSRRQRATAGPRGARGPRL